MCVHADAKLGLAGRLASVRAIEDGCSLKAAGQWSSPTEVGRCLFVSAKEG